MQICISNVHKSNLLIINVYLIFKKMEVYIEIFIVAKYQILLFTFLNLLFL